MDTNTLIVLAVRFLWDSSSEKKKISNNKTLRNYEKNKLFNIGQRKEDNHHHQAEICKHWVGKQQDQMETS